MSECWAAASEIRDSALHLLAGNGTSNLRSVDLEDNNLYDLAAVLRTMTELRHLVALHLKGNPCSTCHGYKGASLQMLPHLEYLDNVEVWSVDRELPPDYNALDHVTSGTLLFQCFRLMGLPQPLPEKMGNKVTRTA
ncbi:unnamed protein product [Timema podura]|uniref:Uncharacterized protein n=1 Tax=Timema podura TaxID=61482 RepID=A0ABN7NWP6_TIMPD|nr:unnamed protein product [Timema podura]